MREITTEINERHSFIGDGDMCIVLNKELTLPVNLQNRSSFSKMTQAYPGNQNLQKKFAEHLEKL